MKPERSAASRTESFRNAFAGLGYTISTQRNAWIHSAVTIAVIGLAIWLRLAALEWAALVAAMGLVWVAELFNTSLETIIDLTSPEVHPLAARAKDVSAAAVMVAALAAALIGGFVFIPHLFERLAS